MRKQTKNKRAACALCKPHKRGWANRWRAAERGLARAHAAEMIEARRIPAVRARTRARGS